MSYRTHTCGELRLMDAGKKVRLAGWMENVREVGAGLAFLVLRDFYGTTQVVLESEELVRQVREIHKESTIQVDGVVRERSSKNPKLETGDIEVVPEAGGILHCYSEDAEFARLALKLPLYFSFAGNLTYRNARNLHETVRMLPIDRILVESESPFMPPAPYRKERNMPANIVATVEFMAKLLKTDVETLAAQLWKNSCKAFHLPE